MIKKELLIKKLYKLYPRFIAKKNHDYVGLMVQNDKKTVQNICLCLDLDIDVINQIKDKQIDLVITHHPFLYGRSKKNILKNDHLRNSWYNLLKELNICVYSFHTNFDEANGGMNDVLTSKLELNNVYAPSSMPMMRVGYLKDELKLNDFASYCKDKLHVSYCLLTSKDDLNKKIKKVAIIGGGGSSYYLEAKNENADIFISGDAPHHIRRDIQNNNFTYLEVPHEVERVFMEKMKKDLLKIDPSLNILIIDHEVEPRVL